MESSILGDGDGLAWTPTGCQFDSSLQRWCRIPVDDVDLSGHVIEFEDGGNEIHAYSMALTTVVVDSHVHGVAVQSDRDSSAPGAKWPIFRRLVCR